MTDHMWDVVTTVSCAYAVSGAIGSASPLHIMCGLAAGAVLLVYARMRFFSHG